MRYMLHSVQMDGVVVIGEGEKDEAPMLYNGEQIGDGSPPQVDIAVDPLEGTTLAAHGMPSALAVIALSARGTMFDPGPCVYMEKMAGAPDIADLLDLDRPLGETVGLVAERKGCPVGDVMVVVLDRPRHEEGIAAIRDGGRARAADRPRRRLGGAAGGDRALARRPAVGDRRHARGRDLGGGGEVPRRPAARTPVAARRDRARRRAWTPATTSRACSTATIWSPATTCSSRRRAITDGDVLQGVRYPSAGGATTESLVTRSRSGTIRRIRAHARSREAARGQRRALLDGDRGAVSPRTAVAAVRRVAPPRVTGDWR